MSSFDTEVIGARKEMVECELVGEGMADLVGIGVRDSLHIKATHTLTILCR